MERGRPRSTPLLLLLLLLLLELTPAESSRSAGRGPAGLDAHAARRVLNVTRESTRDEIRAAFRRASLTTHPDKDGGSTERFVLVGEAYEVLRHGNHDDGGDYDDDGDADGHDAGTSRWDAAGHRHRHRHRHRRRRRHPRDDDDTADDDTAGDDAAGDVGGSFRRRSFDEFARSRGAWDAAGVGGGGGDGWGDDLWDSPTGRRRAAASAAFGDSSAHHSAAGGSRKWYERGRGDAPRGHGPRTAAGAGRGAGGGAGRGGVGGSRPRNDNPGDSFGFDDDWVRRDLDGDPGDAHHPGHSRTNPRAARLHDDTDGAIPQGPGQREGAAGGGGKWWERAKGWNGEGGSDGGVFHPLFRDGFVRSDRRTVTTVTTGAARSTAGTPRRRVRTRPRRVRASSGTTETVTTVTTTGATKAVEATPATAPVSSLDTPSPQSLTTTRPWTSTSRVGRTRTASG